MIERAVAAREGKVELAKIDVDANPGRRRAASRSRASRRSRRFATARWSPSSSAPSRRRRSTPFLDSLLPSEADELVARGDEESLRRAVELEPSRADAAVPLARMLLARGDDDGALALVREVPGSFAADAIAARIALAAPRGCARTSRMRSPRWTAATTSARSIC